MTMDIAAILAIDGIATGAVYALVAIGTVLIFTVTRVIFIPFGDIAAFTALTLPLDAKQFPGTGGLVVVRVPRHHDGDFRRFARDFRALPPRYSSTSHFVDRRRHCVAGDKTGSALPSGSDLLFC